MNSAAAHSTSPVVPAFSALLLFIASLISPACSSAQQTTTNPAASGWQSVPPASPSAAPTKPATNPSAKPTQNSARPPHHSKPVAKKTSALAPPVPAKPAEPPTPAELPPQPAVIHFSAGVLDVRASNSSLEQILREIGAQTGVQIQGVPGDERVFGNFGPGPADRVLAQLLDGSDSNYLMLGRTADHAPKTLVITPRTSLAPGAQTAEAAQPTPAGADDDDDDDAAPPPRPPIRPLIPNGAAGAGVRTPQQILEEMQQRRAQEQQDQQNNPQ
jgi:hypothetical protein